MWCLFLFRDVDKVHDMMDDIAEQQEVAREISDAISNPLAFGQDVDEDDLLKELEDLEQEALDEELLKVGPMTNDELPVSPVELPNVPAASRQPGWLISGEKKFMKKLQ